MPVLQGIDAKAPADFLAGTDVRAKMVVSVAVSLVTVALAAPQALGLVLVCSMLYALGMRRPLLLAAGYCIVGLMLLLALGCAFLVRQAAPAMPPVAPATMLAPFLRLLIMVNIILPLAFTTRLQSLLGSFKSVRLPFCLYIPLTVMVRFIPSFIFDMQQVAQSLAIRGFSLSPKQFFLHPLVTLRVITIPLLFRSLKTSEELGVAAELKGIGAGRRHVPYSRPAWKRRDTLLVSVAAAVLVLAILCNIQFADGVQRVH